MRFIRGHNSTGMDRSGPRKVHYLVEDRGHNTPCWVWQLTTTQANHKGKGGYGKIRVNGKDKLAHRHYYEQHVGRIPDGMQLDHLCKVRTCVNPTHLEPVTPLVNSRRGGQSKLTPEQAREIHALSATGLSSFKVAAMFGVSRQTVDLIRANGPDGPRRPGRGSLGSGGVVRHRAP